MQHPENNPQILPASKNPIMRFFAYGHLPSGTLRETSRQFCELAFAMDASVPDGPEKSAGLRKLLEAKDCMVRAALDGSPIKPMSLTASPHTEVA